MSGEAKNQSSITGFKNDPYGFSEIDKIQAEIERDLNLVWSPDTTDSQNLPNIVDPGPPIQPIPPTQPDVSEASAAPVLPDSTDVLAQPLPEVSPLPKSALGSETETSSEHEAPHVSTAQHSVTETVPIDGDSASSGSTGDSPALSNDAFYIETIKHKTHTRKIRSWRRTVAVICLVCTLGTGTLGLGIGAAIPLTQQYFSGGINSSNDGDNANASANGVESMRLVFGDAFNEASRDGSLADVIKLVEPSVVSVSAIFDTSSEDIFSTPSSGDASGIIFSEDAEKVYIATNYHVVNGAMAVKVSVTGCEPVSAKLVGRDADADLAVISIDKKDLIAAGVNTIVLAVFGDSDEMEMGDAVLAIGNAMGEGNSATYGIISATEKVIPIQSRNLTVLQTDAAINFGNSGGPLINVRGEVIGINTAKLSADYYYAVEGMGYSISSNIAKPILEDMMNNTNKPFLGIQGETVTDEIAEQYNIPAIGVLVRNVISGSGAEKAGIERTDIITSFNGNAIFTMEQLVEEVKRCKVGDNVEVKLLREGKTTLTLMIKLGVNDPENF